MKWVLTYNNMRKHSVLIERHGLLARFARISDRTWHAMLLRRTSCHNLLWRKHLVNTKYIGSALDFPVPSLDAMLCKGVHLKHWPMSKTIQNSLWFISWMAHIANTTTSVATVLIRTLMKPSHTIPMTCSCKGKIVTGHQCWWMVPSWSSKVVTICKFQQLLCF